MRQEEVPTFWVRLYLSGPVDVAKHVIRQSCYNAGLCVTITPTDFIYTGGEESGYMVELINYPRFPASDEIILARAIELMHRLLCDTFQHSALLMTPNQTRWVTNREESR